MYGAKIGVQRLDMLNGITGKNRHLTYQRLNTFREGNAMPYYVYAIHTDYTSNRRLGKFDDFKEASREEENMRAVPGDNYFVRMIFAETDAEAETKAHSLRPTS